MLSAERAAKNQSMISTHHMSCNQSHPSGFYSDKRPNTSALLSYAHISMPKEKPKWNQSASTWRHTSHRYSFSKDNRFKDSPPYYTDIIRPQIPNTITSKTCTFGKDVKKPISCVLLRNAKEKPGPDRYDMTNTDEAPRKTSKGKSFGLGWNAHKKTYIKHRTDAYAEFHTENNPPAHYNVRQEPGKDKLKFSAYGRLRMFSEQKARDKNWVPGPYHEIKDRHLYGTVGMNDRNFAFGERIDLSKPANLNPEAIYHIPGFTERFKNIKRKERRRGDDTR